VLDKISITPGKFYDHSSGTEYGHITISKKEQKNTATHALCFMLTGLVSRWKQTVAYYFTGRRSQEMFWN